MYVYNKYSLDKFKEVLRTISKGNHKEKLEKIFGKLMQELTDEINNYIELL